MKHALLTALILVGGFLSQSGCRTCQPCCAACGNVPSAVNAQAEDAPAPSCPSGHCPLQAQEATGAHTPNLLSFDGAIPPEPIADQP